MLCLQFIDVLKCLELETALVTLMVTRCHLLSMHVHHTCRRKFPEYGNSQIWTCSIPLALYKSPILRQYRSFVFRLLDKWCLFNFCFDAQDRASYPALLIWIGFAVVLKIFAREIIYIVFSFSSNGYQFSLKIEILWVYLPHYPCCWLSKFLHKLHSHYLNFLI